MNKKLTLVRRATCSLAGVVESFKTLILGVMVTSLVASTTLQITVRSRFLHFAVIESASTCVSAWVRVSIVRMLACMREGAKRVETERAGQRQCVCVRARTQVLRPGGGPGEGGREKRGRETFLKSVLGCDRGGGVNSCLFWYYF